MPARKRMTEEEATKAVAVLDDEMVAVERRRQFNVVKDMGDYEGFEEALALFADSGIEIEEANNDNIGDGYTSVEKDKLVNRKCLFNWWSISMPQNESFGSPYVVVRGVTIDGLKFRFTDGSTGIAKELIELTNQRIKRGSPTPNAGLLCPVGLVKNEYPYVAENGESGIATTFHIATEQ